MEYIVVLMPSSNYATFLEEQDGCIKKFSSYEEAKAGVDVYKLSGEKVTFAIYALCSDERNHVL